MSARAAGCEGVTTVTGEQKSPSLRNEKYNSKVNSLKEILVFLNGEAGFCATGIYEPRQVRKEAAVNNTSWAPQSAWPLLLKISKII